MRRRDPADNAPKGCSVRCPLLAPGTVLNAVLTDANRDGWLDAAVLIANPEGDGGQATSLTVLLGAGDGGLATETSSVFIGPWEDVDSQLMLSFPSAAAPRAVVIGGMLASEPPDLVVLPLP